MKEKFIYRPEDVAFGEMRLVDDIWFEIYLYMSQIEDSTTTNKLCFCLN